MDSFRRQKINRLILMNIKFINGKVLDIGGTNNTREILKSFLPIKTNIQILNKNKNYQADILAALTIIIISKNMIPSYLLSFWNI